MVVQGVETIPGASASGDPLRQNKLDRNRPDAESKVFEKSKMSPYEKKYYALLRRMETISQSNERLVNRIHRVKRLIKKRRKERKFLMNRLDAYGDDYRSAFRAMFTEALGDISDSPPEAVPSQNVVQPKNELK